MVSEDPVAYEFADFHLDPAHRRLLRSGEPVPLTPKVFDTLLYLVEHRHAALEKDELLRALWPGRRCRGKQPGPGHQQAPRSARRGAGS